MGVVVSFEGYTPAPRFDDIPWTEARVREATTAVGPFTTIDTIPLDPVDEDPANPQTRELTTDNGTAVGLFYELVYVDANGGTSLPTGVLQNVFEARASTFITQADLENYLHGELDAALCAIAIEGACDIIREAAGQKLDLVIDDEVALDSDGSDVILLPELPVIEITSVVGPADLELVAGTDYVFDSEIQALCTKRRGAHFLRGRQVYVVTYSHGFLVNGTDDPPAGARLFPKSLVALAVTLAARIYDQQLASQESVGGSQITYSVPESIGLSAQEREIVEKSVGVGRRR